MHRLLTASTIAVSGLLLIACNPAPSSSDKPSTTAPTPSAQVSSPKVEPAKSPVKKTKADVEKIDFSKYPGVIRPAAFGFYFGLTREQITDAGIELSETSTEDEMTLADTTVAPVPWADAKTYSLIFSDGRLLKIIAVSNHITNDPTGAEGKAIYKTLQDGLIEKYGKKNAVSYHATGRKVYKEPDEFYQCLGYSGCGLWIDGWQLADKSIALKINSAKQRGSGWVSISYEAMPEWEKALSADQDKANKKTKAGL